MFLFRGPSLAFRRSFRLFDASTRFSTSTSGSIGHYAPRCKLKIDEYTEKTGGVTFTTEEEERTFTGRRELDEFLQKQSRTLFLKYSPRDISKYFLAPLHSQIDLKFLSVILELSDITPSFLISLIHTFSTQVELTEKELIALVKGGCSNYSDSEYLELMIEWEKKHSLIDRNDPLCGYKWGQRIGSTVPIVNVQFLQTTLRPLLLDHWNRDISWNELYEKQVVRLAGWHEDIEGDKPREKQKDLLVPDYEHILGVVAGFCNTWEWGYHVDQRSALFQVLSISLWSHYENRYNHWFSVPSVQSNFVADMICAIVTGSGVGTKQCDSIIKVWEQKCNWETEAIEQVLLRLGARTQNGSIVYRSWRRIKYLLTRNPIHIEQPKY